MSHQSTTTNSLGLPFQLPTATLPVLVGVLSSLALLGGAYNFAAPLEGAKAFGLLPADGGKKTPSAFETAYIRVHGIRNIGVGLGNAGLLLYWLFSDTCRQSVVAEQVVRRCLGIGLVTGTVVGMGDAWILNQYYQDIESEVGQQGDKSGLKEARELASAKSKGHAFTAVGILAVGLGLLLG